MTKTPERPRLRGRLTRWFINRLPRADQLRLTHRNVYILPTRAGLMLGLTLMLLLVGSINYQLNLGYLLTFLLLGCSVVGMHVCHGNLRGLQLRLEPPEPCFARQNAVINITLDNPGRARHGIAMGEAGTDHWSWTDVPAEGSARVQVGWSPPSRGRHPLPRLTAQTGFPLGTFRVWTYWRPAAELLVYPAPESPAPPLPPGEPRPGGVNARHAHRSGEFDGVRSYRRGDPMKAVAWKKAAQVWAAGRDELVSRDQSAHLQTHELWLDPAQCGGADIEHRLSRVCAWVLAAERLGLDYGLRLPSQEIPPDQGPAHQRRCLEALALC